MAIKWSSDAKIDLLTIDGAAGGTGMSPWRMMDEWGVPTFYLQCMANELCGMLRKKGAYVPDIAMAGGFSTEDHIFKVLALGAPLHQGRLHGPGADDPGHGRQEHRQVAQGEQAAEGDQPFGTTKEEIFVCYEEVKAKYGKRHRPACRWAPWRFYSFVGETARRPAAVDGRRPPLQHVVHVAATTCAP